MNETQLTIAGNLVDDPELRFTPSGQPVAKFRIASTPRFYDKQAAEWKDGDTLFLTVNVWRQQAENVAESLTRGSRAIVTGRLRQRSAADLALTWNTARICQPFRRCCARRNPDMSAMPTFAAPSFAWVMRYTSAAPSAVDRGAAPSGDRRWSWSASSRARVASHLLATSIDSTAFTAARAQRWRPSRSSGGFSPANSARNPPAKL